MNLFVLLMCGGKQSRMGSYEGAKQLVPVNGEPCAVRTVRLLRKHHRVLVHVVAPNTKEWTDATLVLNATQKVPTDQLFLASMAEELRSLKCLASEKDLPSSFNFRGERVLFDRCFVLCGDVIFSPRVLEKLEMVEEPVTFVGRFSPNIHTGRAAGELYGFSFNPLLKDKVLEHIDSILAEVDTLRAMMRQVTEDPVRIEDVVEKNARLWRFMHQMEEHGAKVHDVDLWDYIDDIDGPDDLERLPRIEAAIRRRG